MSELLHPHSARSLDAASLSTRLQEISSISAEVNELQALIERLVTARGRMESAEDAFMADLLMRLGEAAMRLTRDRSIYVILRPSRKGPITTVCRLGGQICFRDAEGRTISREQHTDYKILFNKKGAGLDRQSFEETMPWLKEVLEEVAQARKAV